MKKQIKLRNKAEKIRNIICSPVVKILSILKITPNILSYSRIIFMLLFIFFIKKNIIISLIFLSITLLSDFIDGPLARYQNKTSDKGKFIDTATDYIAFTLFIIGLVYADLIDGLIALIFVYFVTLSKIFNSIKNSLYLKSDWHFRAEGGLLLPYCFVLISYLIFIIFIITNKNYLNLFSIFFSFILIIDSIIAYFKILNK